MPLWGKAGSKTSGNPRGNIKTHLWRSFVGRKSEENWGGGGGIPRGGKGVPRAARPQSQSTGGAGWQLAWGHGSPRPLDCVPAPKWGEDWVRRPVNPKSRWVAPKAACMSQAERQSHTACEHWAEGCHGSVSWHVQVLRAPRAPCDVVSPAAAGGCAGS